MSLYDMEKAGKLKKYRSSSTGIQKLLKAAQRRLEDAENSTAHNETRFEQAYEVILICSKNVNYYQSIRRKRHKGLYEGFVSVSQKELGDAIDAADKLMQETKTWLEKNYPLLLRKAKPKESSR